MSHETQHQAFIKTHPEIFEEKESRTGRKYKGKNKESYCPKCEMRLLSANHISNPCPLPE